MGVLWGANAWHGSGGPSKQQSFTDLETALRTQAGYPVLHFQHEEIGSQPATFAAGPNDWCLTYSPPLDTCMLNTKITDWAGLAAGTYDAAIIAFVQSVPLTNSNGDPFTLYWILNHEPENDGRDAEHTAWQNGTGRFMSLVIANRGARKVVPCFCLMAYTFQAAGIAAGRVPANWMPLGLSTAQKAECVALIDVYPQINSYNSSTGVATYDSMNTKAQPGIDYLRGNGWTRFGTGEISLNNDIGAPDSAFAYYLRNQMTTWTNSVTGLEIMSWFDYGSGAAAGIDPYLRTAERRAGFIDMENFSGLPDPPPEGAGTLATFRSIVTSSATAVATSIGVQVPGDAEIGDFLMMKVVIPTSTAITRNATPAGWTVLDTIDDGFCRTQILYRFAVSGVPGSTVTVGWTGANSKAVAWCAAYSGVHPTTPIQVHSAGPETSGSAVTAHTTPTASATGPGLLVEAVADRNSTTTGWNPPGTFTERADTSTGGSGAGSLAVGDKVILAAGTVGGDVWTADVGATQAAMYTIVLANAQDRTGRPKVWNGAAWIHHPMKAGNGTAFVEHTLKAWDGSAWITAK